MRIAWRTAGLRWAGLAALCALLAALPGAARATTTAVIIPPPIVHPPGGIYCPNLTVDALGPGSVSAGHDGPLGTTFCPADGDTVSLAATPDPGAIFVAWSGACQGSVTTCTAKAEPGTYASATFAAILGTLSVLKTGTGAGTVTSSPPGYIDCGQLCSATTDVDFLLTAIPAAHSHFTGWVGGPCDGSQAPCETTIAGPTTITAGFDQDPPAAQTAATNATPPTCATDRSLCPAGTLRLAAATIAVSYGYAAIELTCAGPGGCDEHLVLALAAADGAHGSAVPGGITGGRAHVVLAGAEAQTVHVRLTHRARILFAHRARLRATLAGDGWTWRVMLARHR